MRMSLWGQSIAITFEIKVKMYGYAYEVYVMGEMECEGVMD